MMHSQLPVQSLLCVLLMLPLGRPQDFVDVPLTDAGVQMAAAFAVHQYNKERHDSEYYYKQDRLVKAESPPDSRIAYHLTVDLVQTACKKKPNKIESYKAIQYCREHTEPNPMTCLFKVTAPELVTMKLEVTICP